jgi:cytochrome c-type biogenesis protein CcmH/NrfG
MNELQFAARIRHLLNQGTQLDPALAQRLRAARENALARQRAERASVLVWADNVFGNGWGWGSLSARVVLPVVMLAVAAFGIYRWQENQRLAEVVEIDTQLLTDDLPIDAYLDRGFQNWLKTHITEH